MQEASVRIVRQKLAEKIGLDTMPEAADETTPTSHGHYRHGSDPGLIDWTGMWDGDECTTKRKLYVYIYFVVFWQPASLSPIPFPPTFLLPRFQPAIRFRVGRGYLQFFHGCYRIARLSPSLNSFIFKPG